MKYLKGTFLDDIDKKIERTMYYLIEYDQRTDNTVQDTVFIYSKTYTHKEESELGDKEDPLIKSLLGNGYKEVSEKEYYNDINGKELKS